MANTRGRAPATSSTASAHGGFFLAGLTLFGVGSAACAAVPSVGYLIGGRVVQGGAFQPSPAW